jgi:hypothetical protein
MLHRGDAYPTAQLYPGGGRIGGVNGEVAWQVDAASRLGLVLAYWRDPSATDARPALVAGRVSLGARATLLPTRRSRRATSGSPPPGPSAGGVDEAASSRRRFEHRLDPAPRLLLLVAANERANRR